MFGDVVIFLWVFNNHIILQWVHAVTADDSIARTNLPVAYTHRDSFSATVCHVGSDPVGAVILDGWYSITHIPVFLYDVLNQGMGAGWYVNYITIGY